MITQDCDNRARIAALRGGDTRSARQFLEDIAPIVWTACMLLSADDGQAREAFVETMAKLRAGNFECLAGYRGRGTLETYVALTVRDLLGARIVRLLLADRQKGWRAFEALFREDLLRLIRRRLPGAHAEDARGEAYQVICLAMIESDYRRIRAYQGTGSFAGFVLRTADRLLIDFLRGLASRRRLPSAVARSSALDREVFKLVHWQRLPERADVLAPHLSGRLEPAPEPADIAAALLRVRGYRRISHDGYGLPRIPVELREIPDKEQSTPEAQLVQSQEDAQLTAAIDVLTRAMETLPVAEQLYLTIALGSAQMPPSREIARLMQRPVEEIYKLKQSVLKRLRDLIVEDSAVKNWRASV
jgi:RNA polymerase primary sigma factor